jgi:hypothetical protein
MIQEEYLLYDFNSVITALGGNLGLFVGFSCLSMLEVLTVKIYSMLPFGGCKTNRS